MQSFCRALVELDVLKFVTWILPQLTARYFFSNQSEAGLAKFENSNTESIDHSYLGSISYVSISTITGTGPGRHSIIVDSLLIKLILSRLIVKSRCNAFF